MEISPETFVLIALQGFGLILFFGLLAHIVPYVIDKRGLRAYPGPLLARLSELWLGWHSARGTITRAVRAVHQTYGPVVRISPNHISIADPSALHLIYGHGAATLKSDLYDVFAPIGRTSVFTTRSREEHTRKRKALAHTFSQKSVLDFEPAVKDYLGNLIKHWDSMCSAASKGKGGIIGDTTWQSQDGRAVFDSLRWFNFMVFDIIGDLVFRAPFGMSKRASDLAFIAKHQEKAMESYDSYEAKLDYDTVPAVQAVNERATILLMMGYLPVHWRWFIRKLPVPWLQVKSSSTDKISRLAITAVANRSQHVAARNDILGKYLEARDDKGQKMDNLELSSEALTLLIGGTDTTSNTAAALTFYLAQNPHVQTKLQDELDKALGVPAYEDEHNNQPIPFSYERIKYLPYLQDVVNESLRHFSTVGIGLPRVVQEEGLTVCGHTFAAGTVVSIATYVTNHDKTIWGEDAESFNPDRWEKGDKNIMSRAFVPFSTGPRACLGRNLALMELLLAVASIFHRFEARLAYPGQTMIIHDAFLRKPQTSTVAIKRRGST